jgi:phosphoribosylformylglycinamidine cyclo-ligase
MAAITYKDAGLDLDKYDEAMERLPSMMQRTHSRRVLPLKDGFAGLFRLQDDLHRYQDPVLVSGTDGVGTKIRVAQQLRRYDTIGIDLVAMCVNDCLCVGAEPLFFLDYLAMDRDDLERHTPLVAGVAEGCRRAGLALIGGETAIMPGLYARDDFDLAGFCVGVVERRQIIDGSAIRPGDVVIGIPSSGLHSNGYSLIRKIVFELAGLTVDDHVADLAATIGDVLLEPTRIYSDVVARLMKDDALRPAITGIAHITGGGLADNLVRILPENCCARLDRALWRPHPVFAWLQQLGDVEREEMFRVFNMGLGLLLVCRAEREHDLLTALRSIGESPSVVGRVEAGEHAVVLEN